MQETKGRIYTCIQRQLFLHSGKLKTCFFPRLWQFLALNKSSNRAMVVFKIYLLGTVLGPDKSNQAIRAIASNCGCQRKTPERIPLTNTKAARRTGAFYCTGFSMYPSASWHTRPRCTSRSQAQHVRPRPPARDMLRSHIECPRGTDEL